MTKKANVKSYHLQEGADPYVLDFLIDDHGIFAIYAITNKNIDFVNAIAKIGNGYEYNKPKFQYPNIKDGPGSEFAKYIRKIRRKKHGQIGTGEKWSKGKISYWYKQLKYGKDFDFWECMFALVSIIDSSDNTHLESYKNGRYEMTNLISKEWGSNFIDLYQTLTTKSDPNFVVKRLATAPFALKCGGNGYNFSFASKIYFHLRKIFVNHSYPVSKYDAIIASNLNKYVECYLKKKVSKDRYLISTTSNLEKKESRYDHYQEDIEEIITALKRKGISIDRKDFDNLVWWTSKLDYFISMSAYLDVYLTS